MVLIFDITHLMFIEINVLISIIPEIHLLFILILFPTGLVYHCFDNFKNNNLVQKLVLGFKLII